MPTCIPFAHGVPYKSGPPKWWDPSDPDFNQYGKRIDDPRWRGAYAKGFGAGTAEDATFRALHAGASPNQQLYLSWHVKHDLDADPGEDTLYVGFKLASGQTLIARIVVYNTSGDLTAVAPGGITVGTRQTNGTLSPLSDVPNWMTTTTKVWHLGDEWAVHMQVPVKPGAAVGDDDGLNLNLADFKMWYCFDIFTPSNAAGGAVSGGLLRLCSPEGATPGVTGAGFTYPNPDDAAHPWESFGIPPTCTSSADVTITPADIGAIAPGTDPHEILVGAVNTFYARPKNLTSSSINANQIQATFYIANWGSVLPDVGTGEWQIIPGGQNVPNSAPIGAGMLAAIDNITFPWTPPPGALTRPHQCMLVELSGGGYVFYPASVYRNMDFVGASTFERDAEINVRGLPETSLPKRDVYLSIDTNMEVSVRLGASLMGQLQTPEIMERFVQAGRSFSEQMPEDITGLYKNAVGFAEQFNVPATTVDTIMPWVIDQYEAGVLSENLPKLLNLLNEYFVEQPVGTSEEFRDSVVALLTESGMPQEVFHTFLPYMQVHCYYDTGKREQRNGRTYAILGLLPSFGYYAFHQGLDMVGWETQLAGATRIAENLYVIRVEKDGTATVGNAIQAVGERDTRLPEIPIGDWPKDLLPIPEPWLRRLLKWLLRLLRRLLGGS